LLIGFRRTEAEPEPKRRVLLLLDLLRSLASLLAPSEPAFARYIPLLSRQRTQTASFLNETTVVQEEFTAPPASPPAATPTPVRAAPVAPLAPRVAPASSLASVVAAARSRPAPTAATFVRSTRPLLGRPAAATRTVTAFVPAVIPAAMMPVRRTLARGMGEEEEARDNMLEDMMEEEKMDEYSMDEMLDKMLFEGPDALVS
jgi:hypothetical protein